MKVRALASISGPMGRKVAGDEFVVSAGDAQSLIDRKLVEPVPVEQDPQPATEKPKKPKAAAKE
ncbi:hypothetical protein AB4P95_20070 [Pseudomonas sp. A1437]|uniref:hypothetical protein n=1 Tax=unclassified Pseudomonas TaxID=196821 RepID=UPI003785286B